MIAFASKKKKAVREELLQLRTMAADWKVGSSLINRLRFESLRRLQYCAYLTRFFP
jgi:hypothetical protein